MSSKKDPVQHASSFRDPAGFIFKHGGAIYRQINQAGKDDYEHFMNDGLYDELVKNNWLVAHKEVSNLNDSTEDKKRYKVIKPDLVPFISYPYEWTAHQLRDAALLTLKVQKLALTHGMILKDASVYNVQFIGKNPIFIDTLSFWRYNDGDPWEGYKQFCEHFVAPLALSSYTSPEILRTLGVFLDGIPLQVATKLLPSKARLKRGLLAHVYIHGASQKHYDKLDAKNPSASKRRKVSKMALSGLLSSLESTIKKLSVPKRDTQWGDYYNDTNYSKAAFNNKKKVVEELLGEIKPAPKIVWDLGANDGTFSKIAAKSGAYTVAFDMDSLAVEQNYLDKENADKILPLTQELSNPSPGLGWAHAERYSLEERGPADVALALALIHHLSITNHLPFTQTAEYFSKIGKHLIIEFVPKEDSKVQLLLSGFSRNEFSDYTVENFEKAFNQHFKLLEKKPVQGSKRIMYLYKSRI